MRGHKIEFHVLTCAGILFVLALANTFFPAAAVRAGEFPNVSGEHERSIDAGGLTRTYLLYVPSSYDRIRPAPLVLAFHGRHGTGRDQEKLSGLNEVSDRSGFIVVYPDGIGRSWNAGHGSGPAQQRGVDDVGFVSKLIEIIARDFNVDSRRIYATGMSNGAVFVYRLACELSDKIAAIAAVGATMAPAIAKKCRPTRPISVLHIHGTKDRFAPWEGGRTKGEGIVLSVPETIRFWGTRNKCPASSKVTYRKGNASCKSDSPCEGGTEVKLCRIEGGGHTWPGGYQYASKILIGITSRDLDASKALWDFFSKHPMKE